MLVEYARTVSADLWDRRATDDDFLSLRIGTADLPSEIAIEAADVATTSWRERAEHSATSIAIDPLVPVLVELRAGNVVGVVGDALAAEALARGLLLQACTLHSPRDLAVAVIAVERPRAPLDVGALAPARRRCPARATSQRRRRRPTPTPRDAVRPADGRWSTARERVGSVRRRTRPRRTCSW